MYSKIAIKGTIETVTGLHIGTGGEYSAIGAADSPVIRDARTGEPMIPGSSFKGKLRTLLARDRAETYKTIAKNCDDDCNEILSLFGTSAKTGKSGRPNGMGKLIFSDMFLNNKMELESQGIGTPTEIKFENTINRLSAVANPRQIERAIRGCCFDMSIIYEVREAEDILADFELIARGLKLMGYDYLGGSGSRGYGRVKFCGLSAETVIGNDDGALDDILDKCNELLKDVCNEI